MSSNSAPRGMYGNLLSSIFMALSLLVIYDECHRKQDLGPPPLAVLVTQTWCVLAGFAAWFLDNSALSFTADLVGVVGSILAAHAEQYPVPWEPITLIPHFIWVLFLISFNKKTGLAQKLSLGVTAFVSMEACAYYTHQQGIDMMLCLLFIFLLYNAFHICYLHPNADVLLMKGSRVALGMLFAIKISREMYLIRGDPRYAGDAGFEIVKTTSLAAICLMALGAFSKTKSLQDRVERQEDRLYMAGLALEASETAVAVTTQDQQVVWANPAMAKHLQSSKPGQQGTSIIHLLKGLSKQDALTLKQAFDSSGSQSGEIQLMDSTVHYEVSPFTPPKVVPLEAMDDTSTSCEDCDSYDSRTSHGSNSSHQQQRFVVVLKDITAQRAKERAEQAAEREALSTKAMQESMETLTHELRTPLQGIMGITSLLVGDKRLPSDALQNLQLIMASSSLLLVLINNLLDVRKCDVNMMEDFPLSPISCSGPIEDAMGFCRPLATISGVDLRASICQQTMVRSNNLRLQQVIINLLSNAIKYSTGDRRSIQVFTSVKTLQEVEMEDLEHALAVGDEEEVTRSTHRSDPHEQVLVISVADSGGGIPPGQAKKLFRKFSMLDNSEHDKQPGRNKKVGQPMGSGLGLQLCQKFVKRMNGRIWAENNDVGGSTFSFCLPIVQDDDIFAPLDSDTPPTLPRRPRSDSEEFASIPDCSVLLVDDTLINRRVFARILSQFQLRRTEVVGSGPAALEILAKEDFDIVITDVQMPGMSGMELSEAIQASSTLKRRPVVIGLTADTGQRIKQLCLLSGMLDVLHKPITPAELRHYFATTISQLMDARKCSAATIPQSGRTGVQFDELSTLESNLGDLTSEGD